MIPGGVVSDRYNVDTELRDTPTETTDTKEDAALIINTIENFNFVPFLCFWTDILSFGQNPENLADQRRKNICPETEEGHKIKVSYRINY